MKSISNTGVPYVGGSGGPDIAFLLLAGYQSILMNNYVYFAKNDGSPSSWMIRDLLSVRASIFISLCVKIPITQLPEVFIYVLTQMSLCQRL